MIGIIGAMDEEVDIIRHALEEPRREQHGAFSYIIGRYNGLETVLLKSGIGKVNAAVGCTVMIQSFKPTCIINTGSAGAIHSDLDIGDVIIGIELAFHDVDVTAFGYEYGQVPGLPTRFSSHKPLVDLARKACELRKEEHGSREGLIISADRFVKDSQENPHIQSQFPDALLVEMESAAIAQSCHQMGIPFLVIRSVSDRADHSSTDDFAQNLYRASVNSAGTVLEILNHYS